MRILVVDSNAENAQKLKQIVCTTFPNAIIDVENDEQEACYLADGSEFK